MPATLKDIAERANVSVAAVTRVVNHGDTSICCEERQRSGIWPTSWDTGRGTALAVYRHYLR